MQITLKGYLEKSYLDREGSKHITLELDASQSIEIAKLELMGRDLKNHLPILLDVTIRQDEITNTDKEQKENQGFPDL